MRRIILAGSPTYILTWLGALPHLTPAMALIAACMVAPLVWLTATDISQHIIPDSASLAIAGLGVTVAQLTGQSVWLNLISGALLCGALWLGGEIYYRWRGADGIGIGDAKLVGAMTCALGPVDIWWALLLAALGGIAAALMARVLRREDDGALPFGPFLAYGFFLILLLVE